MRTPTQTRTPKTPDFEDSYPSYPPAREMVNCWSDVPRDISGDRQKYRAFLKAECKKLYKAKDKNGMISLIVNHWALREYQTEFGIADHPPGYIQNASGELIPIHYKPVKISD
jgi:hypothetical protein